MDSRNVANKTILGEPFITPIYHQKCSIASPRAMRCIQYETNITFGSMAFDNIMYIRVNWTIQM